MAKTERRVMKRIKPGAIVLIDLGDDLFCFGQVLKHGGLLVFDYATKTIPSTLEEITTKPRLMRIGVNARMDMGYWDRLGMTYIPPDLTNPTYYTSSRNPGSVDIHSLDGVTYNVPRENAVGIPKAKSHDPKIVTERLGYYFRNEVDPHDSTFGKLNTALT